MIIKKILITGLLFSLLPVAMAEESVSVETKNRIDNVPYNERNVSFTQAGSNEFEQMITVLSQSDPDYKQAFYFANASAKLNFCQAYGYLGTFYMHGLGTKADHNEAYHAFINGVKCSDIQSIYGMSTLYASGFKNPQGRGGEEAVIEYLQKACDLEYAPAQYDLALILLKKNPKDKKGLELLKLAANDRYGPALDMYYKQYGAEYKEDSE